MADVLAAIRRARADRPPGGRRRHPVQHLLGAREGAGARVPRPRPRARAEGAATRTSSSASAAASRARKAPRSSRARPTSTSCSARRRCTACRELIRARRATRRPQVDISFPEIEKFDHLPPPRGRRRVGVRVDHGRLQQVLLVLRRALHARRGILAAVRRRADRDRRSRAIRACKEITLLGQNVNAYRGRSPARANDRRSSRLLLEHHRRMSRASSASATRRRTRRR